MMLELRGIITVYATGSASETLLTLNCHWFILTVGIIRVAIYSIEGGGYKVFDSHARDMYGNSHSEGTCVLLEIKSMHKLVQYFQSLYGNEDIYELKGVHIANFEAEFCVTSSLALDNWEQNIVKLLVISQTIHTVCCKDNYFPKGNLKLFYSLFHSVYLGFPKSLFSIADLFAGRYLWVVCDEDKCCVVTQRAAACLLGFFTFARIACQL